ncbi:MAG: DUF499 domain-containing protein [Deltaproteobacteria bacterium]|nr:DUF499 domain-containing protein [Deltaproteobacteria bacterium]
MAMTNRERVAKGFELLKAGMIPFVERELKRQLGPCWADDISHKQKRDLERSPDGRPKWDTQSVLKAMIDNWQEVFRQNLGQFERSLLGELLDTRNRWAHEEPFTSADTQRALDSMQRMLQAVSATQQATDIDKLNVELQRTVFAEQARQKTRKSITVEGTPLTGLKPWREVVTPHKDVASGQYLQAEFAADLAQVASGTGSDEYKDPAEFYRRTFITDGLRELLSGALRRLAGKDGEPVVELQTNFGGGKTHSMLALYHLFGDTHSAKLTGVEAILKDVGLDRAPVAHRAVLVGTALSPGQVVRKPDGVEARTLWGELAWQLGGKAGYKMVADSDARGTSPGSAVLAELFRKHAPCLVLIDEWVAYARQTVGNRDLPSGSFEAQASFAQALTEAAKAAERTLVVASVPASKIEIGGEHGEYALDALRNVFERLGAPWRPASADEGFEIVRRRLFEGSSSKASFVARDAVVESFARMYREARADFPSDCGEGAYREKLEKAYPIHPELFDRLYGDWSTLDKFQRTRGVLRLLAKVIHRLWEGNDAGLLIMPASIPMDDPAVKSELTRYLHDVWEPIISEDVDGPGSVPLQIDQDTPTLGRYSACRRVARTLYMGTAPGAGSRSPGIDDRRIRLGCTQPGETAATFGDALRRLGERAKHIHQDGNRYWVSTKTNLNRLAEDRARDLLRQPEELYPELVARIREEHKPKASRGDFVGVHSCPESSGEVGDEPEARLVILEPRHPHRRGQADSPAQVAARDILEHRGNAQRINRNAVVFVAADEHRLEELLSATAYFLAWNGIRKEEEKLNLDPFQRRQAESKVKEYDEAVALRIRETWIHGLVPTQKDAVSDVQWDEIKVTGDDTLARRTAVKLRQEGLLMPELGGEPLRMALDRYLWTEEAKHHVSVAQLAEWLPRYLYLPRVRNRDTLEGAIRSGVGQFDIQATFAFATGFDEAEGRYLGLLIGGSPPRNIESAALLVKPAVALRQPRVAAPSVAPPPVDEPVDPEKPPVRGAGGETTRGPAPAPKKPTLFVGSVTLNADRLGRDAGTVADEILQHLTTLPGARATVTLEIEIEVAAGIGEDVKRTVDENCKTLKFKSHGFETT